jgi:hypothetical protein
MKMAALTVPHRVLGCCVGILILLAAASGALAVAPGFGYATDTNNQIVGIDLSNGDTSDYQGQTLFPANALAYADDIGTAGSVIYSSNTTAGELAVWDRATNTHVDIGNIASTTQHYSNPYTGGSIADATYWGGGSGVLAGYYVVSSSRNLYRVVIGPVAGALTIVNVTLAATIPQTTASGNLSASFSFGDVAFDPASGLLFLSDSSNGLVTYDLSTNVSTKVSSRYDGQLAFCQNGVLYGVGNSAGTPNTQGNDFYTIDPTTGLVSNIVLNTDPNFTYRDFAGAASIDIVPEPGSMLVACAGVLLLGAIRCRWT